MTGWYDAHLVLVQGTFVNVLLALSVQIPLRCGVFSFAGVGFYGLGGYLTAIAMLRYHQPSFVALTEAAVATAIVGYLLALLLQRLTGLYLGMATVAFDLIFTVVATNGGSLTGGASGLFGVVGTLTTAELFAIVVVVVGLAAMTERGAMGRRIQAVRDDPELGLASGINVLRVRRLSFVASAVLGACSGGLNILLTTTIAPSDISFSLVTTALTMIVVGGMRSWLGAAVGALIFTWLPSVLQFAGAWQAVVYGLLVAVVAVWAPGGVVGTVRAGYLRFREGTSRDFSLVGGSSPTIGPVASEQDGASGRIRKGFQ
jgi:branched-chain amino acid transport system permease protein